MSVQTTQSFMKISEAIQSQREFFYDYATRMAERREFQPVVLDLTPYVVKTAAPLLNAMSLLRPAQVTGGNSSGRSRLQEPGWLARPTIPGDDGKAAKMPGTAGHAATNTIDRLGGLDPTGKTVDGNNAAGIAKQPGAVA